MADGTSSGDILRRIDALRQLGADCGGGGGTKWILLDAYNKNVTTKHPNAITLVDLLGVSDESMIHNFGKFWRRAFKEKKKKLGIGFTHREFQKSTFITVGDEVDSDVPCWGNIVHKGSDIARSIRDHVEKINAQAAAAEEGTKGEKNTEEDMEMIDTPRNATAIRVDEYVYRLARCPLGLIPDVVEDICKRGGLCGIYGTLLNSATLINVSSHLRSQKKRKLPPSEWTLLNALRFIQDEIEYDGGTVDNPRLQSFLLQTLQSLPRSGDAITLNFTDTKDRIRTKRLKFMKRPRACKPDASEKSKVDYVSRVATSVVNSTTESLGNNFSPELASAVFNKIGERFGLVLLDVSKTCYTFAELVAASTYCKTSLNGACKFIKSLIKMRPSLKKIIFPTGYRAGMSNIINSGNLPFEVKEMELVVSKKKNISGRRSYWCLMSPAHQFEQLVESSILDGSFRQSFEFSHLHDAIVPVFGIDKAAENTGAAIRIANRRNGNTSDHTQLLAAVMDAAECHTNFIRTFFHESCPLKHFLQSLLNDWYQTLVLRVGGQCRCITFTPLPRFDPCTLRNLTVNVAQLYTCSSEDGDDIDWHDGRLPPEVPAHSGVVTVRLVRNAGNKYIGLQFLSGSTMAVHVSVQFREYLNVPNEEQAILSSILNLSTNQVIGFPAVDYKCQLCMSGIGGSSSSYCCTSCMRNKNDFKLPSEAIQRYRDPDKSPTVKDAPLRVGRNSVVECYKRSAQLNGNSAITLSARDSKTVNDRNGSVVHPPCLDTPPGKNLGGPCHNGGGLISHFIENQLNELKKMDEESKWLQDAKEAPKELDNLLSKFNDSQYTSLLTENRALAKNAINLGQKVEDCHAALDSMRKAQEVAVDAVESSEESGSSEHVEVDESVNTSVTEQALIDNLNTATKELEEALKECLDHAELTKLAHRNKVRRALNQLRPLVTNYLKKKNKRPTGKMQYALRSAIKAVGGKFLTQHGGSELTTDNGMDVIERFQKVVELVVNVLPPNSDEGKKVREAYERYAKVAEKLMPVLRLLKSQDKIEDNDEVLRILNEFITAWEDAFPGKYFIKLHHLMQHVYEVIKIYGMCGILSEESMEALHKRINDLMSLSSSQTVTKRIAATNAKAQTIGKTEVANNLKIIQGVPGTKRGPYNINRPSESDETAASLNRYEIVTIDGEEFAVIMNGEGHLPIKFLELYDLLAHGRVPREWTEAIRSSEQLTSTQKEQLSYTDD